MKQPNPQIDTESRRIPTVDVSPFFSGSQDLSTLSTQRLKSAKLLVEALHSFGFAKVTGHGLSYNDVSEAIGWVQKLFDLPFDEKMKAPHPPGPMPHRGYSGIGEEKVYSQEDVNAHARSGNADVGHELRKISDFKESYEIGSENDPVQQNIWLPEGVLPGFREYETSLYGRLADISKTLLEAIGVGLGFDSRANEALSELMSDRHCQLRLLHYPAVSKIQLQKQVLARLPPHRDWGTITLLFQDNRGGLELKDAKTGRYLHAEPEEGAFVVNVGDMLQRFSNDYFVSALHQVTVPDSAEVPDLGLPARYSIPFFVAPDFSHTISTLSHFVSKENPAKYEPVRFDQYGELISKYQYQSES
ncbi:1-aminocyclopropane-1-carboxylate oxidase [Cytospora mali]|uniref:1-aminocyclopropane-1-carboxylate oxidase n=1 Tax=Cytospora mali TaxID=578113 RepID=A0A194WBL1_CYTMA|nr:1-aminocyclopropane-1-carboxylate oxidase [Valsa mali]